MANTLAFRNADQLAIWKMEITGQLSDGHWENTRPHDHWKVWCRADAICDPANPGRDFWAQKENYNFTSGQLLEVVADRMVGYVRLARALGLERVGKPDLRWCVGCDGKLERYNRDRMGAEDAGIVVRALEHECYTRKDLMRDLRDMKNIIKMRRNA